VGAGLDCAAYWLYARSDCDTKVLLQLQYAVCGAVAFAKLQSNWTGCVQGGINSVHQAGVERYCNN